jgi:hypothetical protein
MKSHIGGISFYCVYIFYSIVPYLHHNCTRKREGDSNIELHSACCWYHDLFHHKV